MLYCVNGYHSFKSVEKDGLLNLKCRHVSILELNMVSLAKVMQLWDGRQLMQYEVAPLND